MISFLRIIAAVIGFLLLFYFVWFAVNAINLEALQHVLTSPRVIFGVIVAALLYALIIPITALAWRQLLVVQGESWQVDSLARFLGLAQLAKYIPGNIAQHAARVTLCLRAGMSARAMFASTTQELLLSVAASFIVGLVMLTFSTSVLGLDQLSISMQRTFIALAVCAALGVLAIASFKLDPVIFSAHPNSALRLLARVGGLPGPKATLTALTGYIVNYLLIGFGLWLVALAIDAPASMGFATVTAVFALSWTLGFLAPGAPAGLGAREGIMLLLLQGSAPTETLLMFVVLARVITMLGDGICFAVASISQARSIKSKRDR